MELPWGQLNLAAPWPSWESCVLIKWVQTSEVSSLCPGLEGALALGAYYKVCLSTQSFHLALLQSVTGKRRWEFAMAAKAEGDCEQPGMLSVQVLFFLIP